MPARRVVVLDNLSTGFGWAVPAERHRSSSATSATRISSVASIRKHGVEAIIHFAGSIVVPESVADPLGYYLNNTVKSRALIEVAVELGVPPLHLLLDRRRLRHAEARTRSREDAPH